MNHNFHDIESGVSDFLSPLRMACFFYEEYGGIFDELLWTANQRIPSGYD